MSGIIPFGFAADFAINALNTDFNNSTDVGMFFGGSAIDLAKKNSKVLKKAAASSMKAIGKKALATEAAAAVGKFIPVAGQIFTAGEIAYGGYQAWNKYKQCVDSIVH